MHISYVKELEKNIKELEKQLKIKIENEKNYNAKFKAEIDEAKK